MRLITYFENSRPAVGALAGDGAVAPLPFGTMLELIVAGEAGLAAARKALAQGPRRPLAGLRLAAPIPEPRRNIVGLGWNYADHSKESAAMRGKEAKLPTRPIFFTKATTSVLAPEAPIPSHPEATEQLDWEVELGVVIGPGGLDIPRERALEHVFGYTVINDVSAREVQTGHGGQFFKGKSMDGTCPMGPVLVTRDEIPDPQALRLVSRVNGVVKQDGFTGQMIFDVASTIEWLSKGMTLLPGDIIATGTPAGVGFARNPPEFLKPGDVVECEVEGIGVLRNPVS
ncbi:MAG: fumarylacetoacetate hydrolase family protein [Holophaga sp.]|jgi:2-keto-4-pentenoate hydratase/2-oxohepta-3-ene-1,7-dioic acid hydratase in catechol pathway